MAQNAKRQVTWDALRGVQNWLNYQKDFIHVGPIAGRGVSPDVKTVTKIAVMSSQIDKDLRILAKGLKKSADPDYKLVFESLIKQYTERQETYESAKKEIVAYLELLRGAFPEVEDNGH